MPAIATLPLYIDVTDTLARDGRTGIQRVVRQFVRWLPVEAALAGWEVRLIAAVDGRFHRVAATGLDKLAGSDARVSGPTPALRPAGLTPASRGAGAGVLLDILHQAPALLSIVQRWNLNRRVRAWLYGLIEPAPVTFAPTDVLLLLDSHWGGTTSVAAARRAAKRGVRVVTVVYDLIPVTHPRDALPLLALTFARRIRAALAVSVACLTISRTCASQIRDLLGTDRTGLPVGYFHLGADAARPAGNGQATGHRPRSYLMIGSIEPHKGHAVVLDAFERRWREGREGDLVIVGRQGQADAALIERLEAHPERGARLYVLNDASDRDMTALLARATTTIMASRAEGFGLPIVESLHAGVPVIASDIPVFREIGGNAICYFRGDDPDSLIAAMARVERDGDAYRASAKAFSWITWQQSARQAVTALRDVLAQASAGAAT